MTDTTTPATDEQVTLIKAGLAKAFPAKTASDLAAQMVTMILIARIAADAETIRQQAEEIERLKAQVQVGHDVIRDFDAKIDEARDQVRVLREALKAALDHCDCSDYNGKALIPCTEANPCAGCYTMRTGQSALAATEPKG